MKTNIDMQGCNNLQEGDWLAEKRVRGVSLVSCDTFNHLRNPRIQELPTFEDRLQFKELSEAAVYLELFDQQYINLPSPSPVI